MRFDFYTRNVCASGGVNGNSKAAHKKTLPKLRPSLGMARHTKALAHGRQKENQCCFN
ncbi:MAG: hypothetical protein LBS59_02940 [Puniceicoccales bacterium]|nr:hypothetical protein [Puniceicoccales bacterium]